MERKLKFSEGEYYHGYNRGVEKRIIFLSKDDYRHFVRLLYVANGDRNFKYRDIECKKFLEIDRGKPLVAIGAWVLMPNHFHVLLREIRGGGISSFMQKLLTGYSTYFNKRYERVGSLFQGVFQAQHAHVDEYLKYLFSYIHLNPIKFIDPKWKDNKIKNLKVVQKFLNSYVHSSYLDYAGVNREEGCIISREAFPEYFSGPSDFKNYINDWLVLKDTFSLNNNTNL